MMEREGEGLVWPSTSTLKHVCLFERVFTRNVCLEDLVAVQMEQLGVYEMEVQDGPGEDTAM